MNKVDFDNVKTEITRRGLEFKEGGTFTEDYIKGLSIDELKKLADNYKNDEKNTLINQIKLSANKMFEKYGTEKDNFILFDGANSDYYGTTGEMEIFEEVDKNCDWGIRWCNAEHHRPIGTTLEHDAFDEYEKDLNELTSLIHKVVKESAKNHWMNQGILNEYWSGCFGLTRDMKIVAFTIRDDGWDSPNKEDDLLYDLNK